MPFDFASDLTNTLRTVKLREPKVQIASPRLESMTAHRKQFAVSCSHLVPMLYDGLQIT